MSDTLRIGWLGPLTGEKPLGEAVALTSAVQRRLLAILALEHGHVVSSDRLGELLESSPGSLRTVVSRVRSRIGPDALSTAAPGYVLVATTDVGEFEHLLNQATAAHGSARIALLDRAIALWRGDAVEEFRDESWAVASVARLEELRATAIELRAEAMVTEGMATQAIAEMAAHRVRHPLRERPRAVLMQALAAEGRAVEALRVFQDFRRHLVDEVGTEPSEELRSIERTIASGTLGSTGADAFTPTDPCTFLFAVHSPTGEPDDHRWEQSGDLAEHRIAPGSASVIESVIATHNGVAVQTGNDTLAGVFDRAQDALEAARQICRRPGGSPPTLSVALHYGPAARRDDRWFGPAIDEGLRIAELCHPGQILVSEIVASMLDARLTDLGEHRIRDVQGGRRLFQADGAGEAERFPPLRSVGSYQTTLPAQRTTLVGRDELAARVRTLVHDHRLVTLLGPGGVGKTRLAVEAAGRALGSFPGGVFFADLTRAATDAGVAAELLRSMKAGPKHGQSESDTIDELLRDRTALVVVDNCEHVIDQAAAMVDDLLAASPDTRVLATSREPLALRGERRLIVPSLDVDGPRSSAVRLFVDRATAMDDAITVDDADLTTVVEIARRLDGIPLAIELAAAQVASLPPTTILQHLDDRFTLLTSTLRRVPLRQQTLAATVDWSYRLLDPDDQRALRLLTACAGAFSSTTAARVLDLPIPAAEQQLERLRAKSLLYDVSVDGARLGYNFLETLRAFGRARSAELGTSVDVTRAIEDALMPSAPSLEDWTLLVNDYLCAPDPSMMIEDATRLAAGAQALDEGRLDHAAFILGTVAYREEVGALKARWAVVRGLAERRDELHPTAWLAASATELLLARGTRDYGSTFEIATRMLGELDPDHPARCWFGLWRCALTAAIDPHAGLTAVDTVLPSAHHHAHPPLDWTVSQLLGIRATACALVRRLDDAAASAADAGRWAPVGQSAQDQSLALCLWISYLRGVPAPVEVLDEVAAQSHGLGRAALSAAPGALCSPGSVVQRATMVVELARRHQELDVATPLILAFAWLAIEEDDLDHARELLACAELWDASTQVALTYAVAAIDGWTDAQWDQQRDAMVVTYLGEDQARAARRGAQVLEDEVVRWDLRLDGRAEVTGRSSAR